MTVIDWCCLYKRGGETIDHHLLLCGVANALWIFVVDLLACWIGKFAGPHRETLWIMIPCVWRERNDCVFEDCHMTMAEVKDLSLEPYTIE